MLQEFIVCTFLYVVIVAIAYQPKSATETESQPINYFPEVEETEEETDPEPTPIVIVERRPVAAFTIPVATVPAVNYSAMGVRELYKVASKLGHKNVKKLSKSQLVALLSE